MSYQIIWDIAILIYIFYKQLQPKEIDFDSKGQYIILIIGAVNMWNEVAAGRLKITAPLIIGALISFVVLAVGFAYLRTITCKIWHENGKVYRKGNYKTLILWALMIIIHAIINYYIAGLESTFVLYVGISFTTQYLTTRWIYLKRKIH